MKIGSGLLLCGALLTSTAAYAAKDPATAPAAGAETVAPMEPDWCEGFKASGANAAKSNVTYDALASNFDKAPTGPVTLWIATQLSCEMPKDAKVQKAVAAVRQAYVNETGETEKDSRLQLKLRADAARYDKDQATACPRRHVQNPEDSEIFSATGNVLCNGGMGEIYKAPNWQAFAGGLNNVWPGFLGFMWNEAQRDSDRAGEIAALLEKFDAKAYAANEKNLALAARGLQMFYTARKQARAKKPKTVNPRGILTWFDYREKNPELFEKIAAVHKAEATRSAAHPNQGTYESKGPAAWLPECEALHQSMLKLHPTSEPTSGLEITKAFNRPDAFEALKTLEYCGYVANDRPRANAYWHLRGDLETGTRRDKTTFPGPSMEWKHTRAPFSGDGPNQANFSFLARDPKQFGFLTGDMTVCTAPGGTGLLDGGSYAGATVQTLKDTPEGTLVAFKTESWQTDNMVCTNDNTYSWDHVGNLVRGMKCVKQGTKTVKFQELPMVLTKDHGVQGIKPGVYLSVSTVKCPNDTKAKPVKAFPLITYPSFKKAERSDIQSYFWWTIKGGKAAPAATAAAPKAKKK